MSVEKSKLKAQQEQLDIPVVIGSVFFVVGWDGEQESRFFVGKTRKDCEKWINEQYNGIYYSKKELCIDEVEIKHYL